MKAREVYKIACAEYIFGGPVFERIINESPCLHLAHIHLMRDDLTRFFEVPVEWKEDLINNSKEIKELLDGLADKYCNELHDTSIIEAQLGGVIRVGKRIQLELAKNNSAVLVYERRADKYIPVRLYIWYITETFVIDDGFQHQLIHLFPYTEDTQTAKEE